MEDLSQFASVFIGFSALLITGITALFGVVKYLLSIIRKATEGSAIIHAELDIKIQKLDELMRDRTAEISSRVTRLETIDEVNQRPIPPE